MRIAATGTIEALEVGDRRIALDAPLLEHSPDPDVAIAWPLPAAELVPSQRDVDAPLLRDVADGLPFEYR